MSVVHKLCVLAVRHVVTAASKAVGVDGDAAFQAVQTYFTDHSGRLSRALQNANERAWQALELALGGESFWERCKLFAARAEDKAFGLQVRAFLDAAPLPELAGKAKFRQAALDELRAARKAGLLTGDAPEPQELARRAGAFARFSDPESILKQERQATRELADEVRRAGHGKLAWFLSRRPAQGDPLLVVAVRYFFRREIEGDPELFRGLTWAKLEGVGQAQEAGFGSLAAALDQHADRLGELLAGIQDVVVATRSGVLDLQAEQRRTGEVLADLYDKVVEQHRRFDLLDRHLRREDSLSLRCDAERQLVRALVLRFRALPADQQSQLPALLNALAKLQVLAGHLDDAQEDFGKLATTVAEPAARAEAHFNAYQTALGRGDWDLALEELLKATRLDARRYAPFPVGKYHPRRILGAGAFGVAFLCRHKTLDADVVVKALRDDGLGRDVEEVLTEARVLHRLEHPCVVHVFDCGYALPRQKARPYFVMGYFDGVTLQEQVHERPLAVEDCLAVARGMAEGLRAAHAQGVLHRDVKPANVLVRRDDSGWQVKLIDFGLAVRTEAQHNTRTDPSTQDVLPTTGGVAGTVDYAAPEQMGRLPGVAAGPYSDVYGLAKTCCYALFRTTQPLPKHWQNLPAPLAQLLGECLEEDPAARPPNCGAVIARLNAVRPGAAPDPSPTDALAASLTWLKQAARPLLPGGAAPAARAKEKPPGAGGKPAAVQKADPEPAAVEVVGDVLAFQAHEGRVQSVTFAADGNALLSAGADGTVRLWDLRGKELLCLQTARGRLQRAALVYATFTPDAARALSAATDGTIRLWDLRSGTEVRHFEIPGGITAASLSADGRQVLSAVKQAVTLWDVEHGRLLLRFGGRSGDPTGDVRCVGFTPGGAVLAGGRDGVAVVYSGKGRLRLEGHTAGVNAVSAHPSGRRILTGGGDRRLFAWDLDGGDGWPIAGHTGEVLALAASSDGRLALSGGADRTVRLWQLDSRKQVGCFTRHAARVGCVAFSPLGRQAASGGDDGSLRIWPVAA
jgi:hypothetical protein